MVLSQNRRGRGGGQERKSLYLEPRLWPWAQSIFRDSFDSFLWVWLLIFFHASVKCQYLRIWFPNYTNLKELVISLCSWVLEKSPCGMRENFVVLLMESPSFTDHSDSSLGTRLLLQGILKVRKQRISLFGGSEKVWKHKESGLWLSSFQIDPRTHGFNAAINVPTPPLCKRS